MTRGEYILYLESVEKLPFNHEGLKLVASYAGTEQEDNWEEHVFEFKSKDEAVAFAKGVSYVNDSSVELLTSDQFPNYIFVRDHERNVNVEYVKA